MEIKPIHAGITDLSNSEEMVWSAPHVGSDVKLNGSRLGTESFSTLRERCVVPLANHLTAGS